MKPINLLVTIVCAFVFAGAAFAQNPVELKVIDHFLVGSQHPVIIIITTIDLKNARIVVSGSDGKTVKRESGPISAGKEHEFSWKQGAGPVKYSGRVEIETPEGERGSMPVNFTIVGVNQMKIEAPYEKLDLANNTLQFRTDRQAKKAELEVYNEDGNRIAFEITEYTAAKPGEWLSIKWSQPKSTVLKMMLKVFDKNDYFNELELVPWSINIPHEDLHFETGKWDILPDEEPKLKKALGDIQDAVRKYGHLVKVKLYVAGYTDTVGDPKSNLALSENRARSIAGWFKKKGLTIPIYARGFGETVLAVDTPDETDEILNRRAIYVIAAEPPRSPDFPGGRPWAKVN